jgi:hypothetical protein
MIGQRNSDSVEYVWEPHDGPQSFLLACPAREIFYGGARGGGKTDGMLGEWAKHAAMYGEYASGLMVRRSRTELVETIERSKQIFSKLGATFNEARAFWRFANGARLRFGYLERDSDADQFQGWSLTRLYVEEAGTFPSERPILKLMATLRSGHGVPVKFIATGNPGGAGQGWVKARWIDPHPPGNRVMKRSYDNPFTGDKVEWDWVFIPSLLTDNPSLDGSDYVARLAQVGSKELVRAWLQGDWNAVEGAFFSEWDYTAHVVPAEAVELAALDGLFFRSIDLGFAAPFSVGWWCHLKEDFRCSYQSRADFTGPPVERIFPAGCLIRIAEWYGANAPGVGLRLPAETLARGILKRDPLPFEKFAYTVIDPKAFHEEGGPSHAERMAGAGIICRPADNKRSGNLGHFGGWDVLRQRLTGDVQGRPMIVCFDTCLDSIRTIPTLQHDPDKAEDLDTEQEDHCADEWRYAVMSRPWHHRSLDEIKSFEFKDYVGHTKKNDRDFWLTL